MPIADRNEQLSQAGSQGMSPSPASHFRQIVDALLSTQPPAGNKPRLGSGSTPFSFTQQAKPFLGQFESQLSNDPNSLRSKLRMGSGAQGPVWGFHEPSVTVGEAMGPIMGGAGQALQDPRNMWMGVGPMAGVIGGWKRGIGGDLGGFRPRQVPNVKQMEPIGELLDWKYSPGSPAHRQYLGEAGLQAISGHHQGRLDDTINGMEQGALELKGQRDLAMRPQEGGSIPPQIIIQFLKDRFGYGE